MKLSTVLIGSLLATASVTNAQEQKRIAPEKVVKKESIRINEAGEPIKLERTLLINRKEITPPDSLKNDTLKIDTNAIKHNEFGPDYCPPCGMG